MTERLAHFPPQDSPLGARSWMREFAAAVAVTLNPPPFPKLDLPLGDGRPVLILPGFGSSDWSNLRLHAFLTVQGYRAAFAGVWFNPGPIGPVMRRIEKKLLALSQSGPVSLVGVSLGGVLARDLARRHPEMVRNIVTLCSPVRFPVTTPLAPLARLLSPFHPEAWLERRHTIADPLDVPVTAVHVTDDGILERAQCWLDPSPDARNVVVSGRHMMVQSNPEALRLIAESLAAIC